MAITTGSRVSVALKMILGGQVSYNIWDYNVLEIIGTPTAGHYGEGWWNHVKATYRALQLSSSGATFQSVRVTELGSSTGEYGEFAIPAGEQAGTRTAPTDADSMPTFTAVGVRLAVGTRVTRPGQKRFGFLTQNDVLGNDLQTGFNTLLVALMNVMVVNMTLGAPAAGVVLVPQVVGLNPDGSIRASQLVTGYAINQKITSQVSRKFGRGS